MAKAKRLKKKKHRGRGLLVLLLVAVGLVAAAKCLIRPPEIPQKAPPPQSSQQGDASGVSSASSESGGETQVDTHSERKDQFYTILVSGEDDKNGGSDTNILMAVDVESGAIRGVSIPRDSGAYINGKARKINYAFNSGGMELLQDTVSDLLGVPVDFYVSVDLKGFVELVDAIGGVTFDVPINMNYDDPIQDLHIHVNRGVQRLDGKTAMGVVRFRHNNDGTGYGTEDLGRIQTQQAFLKAVAKQVLQPSNLGNVGSLAKIFQTYVDTNLTVGNLAWLGQEAFRMGLDNISFSTLPGAWSDRRSLYMVDAQAALELVNQSFNPYMEARTAEDMNIPQ